MSGAGVVRVRCPAKINLALRILERRCDGYHELDTVFQAIDWWDEIEASADEAIVVECDDPTVPSGPDNLAWRAADLLRRRIGPGTGGARLVLHKRIPAQAGLGGGSSDAAGALLACARLWGIEPGRAELAELAGRLGADVAFFLVGGTARGRGRGERIEPLPFAGSWPLVVGVPPFGCSTAEVYAGVAGRLTLPGIGVSLPVFSGHKWQERNDFGFVVNDLEQVAFEVRPELRGFRDALLEAGARRSLLSGSGSAVFGIFDNERRANAARGRLVAAFEGWRLVTTRPVERGAHVTGIH